MEKIIGIIKKVMWTNGSYSIVSVQTNSSERIGCKGNIPNPTTDVKMEFDGTFEDDPKYGRTFKVVACKLSGLMSEDAMIAYLSSGFIKGIGKVTAQAIVKKFGVKTLEVIENDPKQLATIPRITEEKANKIHDMHTEHNVYMDIYNLFGGAITDHQVKSIYDIYGVNAVAKIKKDPYGLIYDIDGFGFKKVDALARSYGIAEDADERIGAAIGYVLRNISENGHCYAAVDSIESLLNELLEHEISNEHIADILIKEIQAEHLVYEAAEDRLYLASLYKAETYCAETIAQMILDNPKYAIPVRNIEEAIRYTESICGFEFEDKQQEAVKLSLQKRICVITGGPGTGKTTIVRAILNAYNNDDKALLIAPTGKASRRMSDLTDGLEASTIHKLLMGDKKKYKDFDGLIICDEASMLDIQLAKRLLEFADYSHSSLVLIGDIDQLPPIGPGNFFRDLVNSPYVPTVTLRLSHRNHGSIAMNAASVNEGRSSKSFVYDNNFTFVPTSKENTFDVIVKRYIELIKQFGIENVCCIVPTRKAGKDTKKVSSDDLNKELRELLNPPTATSIKLSGTQFRTGDRVMQTSNDYKRDVFNGDCGTIVAVNADENVLTVKLDAGRYITYNAAETQELVFAYAMTVHKSQGSEYKAIILAECMEHYIMLQRNLLYTGITRAREKVVLIGDIKAVNIAINNVPAIVRNTWLKQRIATLSK